MEYEINFVHLLITLMVFSLFTDWIKIGTSNSKFGAVQKAVVIAGVSLMVLSLFTDWLGIGTSGSEFGAGQKAVIIAGVSLIAWSLLLRLRRQFNRFLYATFLAIVLFLLWCLWLYPMSWGQMNPFRPVALPHRVVVLSHLFILFLSFLSIGIAIKELLFMIQKPVSVNIIVFLVSITISCVLAEMGFRMILFNKSPTFAFLRNPDFYANWFSDDDYWKLQYHFGDRYKPPKYPHPLLGWVGDFSRETYKHNQDIHLGKRRPLLLYGDSFSKCVYGVECFQDILNNDEKFSGQYYLLNYGVGGYGVDQIYLALTHSVGLYENPVVIVGLMTLDLDRSVLTVRGGQKPYFRLENKTLKLCGVPINPNQDQFLSDNPPQIRSYLYRKMLYSSYFPKQLRAFLRGDDKHIRKKKTINEKIILQMIQELNAKNLEYFFVIFHPHFPGVSRLDEENDWREIFLKNLLHEYNIPYIWSKAIFQQDVKKRGGKFSFADYILPDNGHPTSYFNMLIADEIKKSVLGLTRDDT